MFTSLYNPTSDEIVGTWQAPSPKFLIVNPFRIDILKGKSLT
jgi:hypothetical protein